MRKNTHDRILKREPKEQHFFFFFEKQTHTQGRKKWVITQKHTTTPHKSHSNF